MYKTSKYYLKENTLMYTYTKNIINTIKGYFVRI